MVEYPLLSLLILSSHSLWDSCSAVLILYLGGYIVGSTVLLLAILVEGADVVIPYYGLRFQGCGC